MEQWRISDEPKKKLRLLFAASVTLGGCGIWAMHFVGMEALHLRTSEGKQLSLQFEGITTIFSFILAVMAVFLGLTIASRDSFFKTVGAEDRRDILVRSFYS